MRYIVMVEKSSLIGQSFLPSGNHDRLIGGHPVLECQSIDLTHTHFLRVERGPLHTAKGETRTQVFHIPYSAVAAISEIEKTEERAMGFLS